MPKPMNILFIRTVTVNVSLFRPNAGIFEDDYLGDVEETFDSGTVLRVEEADDQGDVDETVFFFRGGSAVMELSNTVWRPFRDNFTVEEVQQALGCPSPQTICNLFHAGKLRGHRLGPGEKSEIAICGRSVAEYLFRQCDSSSDELPAGKPATQADAGGGPMTAREAARRLRCSLRKAYYLFQSGELEGYRVGSKIRVYAESVEALKERRSNRKKAAVVPVGRPKEVRGGPRPRNSTPLTGFRHLQV